MAKKTEYERSLLAKRPNLADEWDYEKNGEIRPENMLAGSSQKAWWRCREGHSWFATVSNRVKGSNCPYCVGKRPIRGKTDLGTLFPVLAAEFDVNSNNGLTPYDFTAHSGKKVKWCCSAGHKWEARIADRVNGVGCPFCSGKIPIKGKTDLKTTRPNIASEWDYESNMNLKPEDFTEHSGKLVAWKCANGHSWQASINTRTKGHNCPYCSGNFVISGETDLATKYPLLMSEWAKDKNGDLDPSHIAANSDLKVWWKCSAKKHFWVASIHNRASGQQCPYCAGKLPIKGETDFATKHPELIKEWDYEYNNFWHPAQFAEHSKKKIIWKCKEGHRWSASIDTRTRGHNCPYCAGNLPISGKTDLLTRHPQLAKEWDEENNNGMRPEDFGASSNKHIYWKCSKGHHWRSAISTRTKGVGCPYCSGRKPIAGETDFATKHPELTKEWEYVLNKGLHPSNFTEHSQKKIWWKCSKNHHWQSTIDDRVRGSGCPYCSGKRKYKPSAGAKKDEDVQK